MTDWPQCNLTKRQIELSELHVLLHVNITCEAFNMKVAQQHPWIHISQSRSTFACVVFAFYSNPLYCCLPCIFSQLCMKGFVATNIPKMGFPLGVLPPKVKTWEWSAVTTVRVSDSRVSCAARWMARSNITASVSASLAMPSWWPWSILPRNRNNTKQRENETQVQKH